MTELTIEIAGAGPVSALLHEVTEPRACYVVAHGAGAGMKHPFLAAVAKGLGERGIATLRYNFPYMERGRPILVSKAGTRAAHSGSKRPDSPKVAQSAVRAAVAEAARRLPNVSLFAGGKSFGGRMTSQAQAESPLPGVRGLVFLGFPLHPPGKPSDERAAHLSAVKVPMLFLQGSRDDFAQLALLEPLVRRLGADATLKLFEDADHSFHVPARTGRKDADVLRDVLDAAAAWMSAP